MRRFLRRDVEGGRNCHLSLILACAHPRELTIIGYGKSIRIGREVYCLRACGRHGERAGARVWVVMGRVGRDDSARRGGRMPDSAGGGRRLCGGMAYRLPVYLPVSTLAS